MNLVKTTNGLPGELDYNGDIYTSHLHLSAHQCEALRLYNSGHGNGCRPGSNWKPRFFTLWPGQAFSLLGSQLVQFALIWYLTEQTGSATTLAVASLVGLLPQVFLSP